MITSQQVSEKFELLDPLQRETVSQFIDFLLYQNHLANTDKKALLLRTSIWTEEDVHAIEEVQKDINAWKLPTFS